MSAFLRLCLAAALLLCAGASSPPRARTVLAATPLSRMDLPWWHARFDEKQAELRQGGVNLLFLGDSITQSWEKHGPPPWQDFAPVWQRFYGDRHAVNLGFTGDTTAHLLWRIENGETTGITPKAAVILIGANNFGRVHWSAEDTVAGIDAIVAALHKRLPQTRLLLLSILPSERSSWITEQTAAANRMLAAKYGHSSDVTYVDVTRVFMRDGRLNRDLFYDPKLKPPGPPLHPDAQGQTLMAEAIEPALAGLLGDRPHSAKP